MFVVVAERFLSNVVNKYGLQSVLSDGDGLGTRNIAGF